MPIDKWAAKDRVLASMMDAIDGFEASNLGKSQAAKQMKKDFPGDALGDALGTHDEECDSVDDEKADLLNKIKR